MNNFTTYQTESGTTFIVSVHKANGEPLAEGETPNLPELREFLNRVYSERQDKEEISS